ncbi:MAG: hypothetical protein ABL974_20755, partial [Prosthecobacter sp.]
RVLATLCHLWQGARRLPENWRENNFSTDSCLPAELMPGIRDTNPVLALDGTIEAWRKDREWHMWLFYPLVIIFCFLPAFLYRLNIKATAWFWWPLAYLLKPVEATSDEAGRQKAALCWPWTDPFQKLLIVGGVGFGLTSLILLSIDLRDWQTLQHIPALTLPVKVMFAIDWRHIMPWHWAQWVIALTGVGMLWLAGQAKSHADTGNWGDYATGFPQKLWLMTGLVRVRSLATLALLLMGAGALLLLQEPFWQPHVPPTWVRALKVFYHLEPPDTVLMSTPGGRFMRAAVTASP